MMDPVSNENKPLCGGDETTLSDDIKTLLTPLSLFAGSAASLAGLLEILPETAVTAIAKALGITGAASSLVVSLIFAYFALQIAIISVFGVNWYRKCRKTGGTPLCLSGIVNTVHDATIPPLTLRARHPHVDLVIKPLSWPHLKSSGIKYIYCSDTGIRGLRSPMVKVFFKSERVCTVLGAAFGGSFAAPVVAIAAFNGILATTGAASLAGALAFFAFALLFWLAAIVAGAIAGAIANAATEPDPPAAGTLDPESPGGQALPDGYGTTSIIAMGDLLTVHGPSVIEGNYNQSLAIRFAEDAYVIGSYVQVKNRPYNHADAMAAIPDDMDICLPPPRPDPAGSGVIGVQPEDEPETPLPVP